MDMLTNLKILIRWMLQQGMYGSSQKVLSNRLGYKESSFSQIVNGHVPVSGRFVNKLCEMEPRINRDWLMNGQGEMLLPSQHEEVTPVEEQEGQFFGETLKGAKLYQRGDQLLMTVKHVPYACFGQFANPSDRLDTIQDDWSEETYEVDRVGKGHYLSFEVKGDSMDTGSRDSFEAGDRVLCRELERVFWRDPIRFHTRPYWVVVFGSSVLIKQMIGQDLNKGTLTFHSLNPSPEYHDFTLREDDIRALYYVIKKKPKEVGY